MEKRPIVLLIASFMIGLGIGYTASLTQLQLLQSKINTLNQEISSIQNRYGNLNMTYNELLDYCYSLETQNESLNTTYNNLNASYEDLLFHYNLVNGPISNFTIFQDLNFTFCLHRTTYYYQDALSGNVTVTFMNGSNFIGSCRIRIRGPYSLVTSISIPTINGTAEFFAFSPVFKEGPGTYILNLSSIKNSEGFYVVTGSVPGTEIEVDVK